MARRNTERLVVYVEPELHQWLRDEAHAGRLSVSTKTREILEQAFDRHDLLLVAETHADEIVARDPDSDQVVLVAADPLASDAGSADAPGQSSQAVQADGRADSPATRALPEPEQNPIDRYFACKRRHLHHIHHGGHPCPQCGFPR